MRIILIPGSLLFLALLCVAYHILYIVIIYYIIIYLIIIQAASCFSPCLVFHQHNLFDATLTLPPQRYKECFGFSFQKIYLSHFGQIYVQTMSFHSERLCGVWNEYRQVTFFCVPKKQKAD